MNATGCANVCHDHPGLLWSGPSHVADGGCASEPSLGGAFAMLDPRGSGPSLYAPCLTGAGEDGAPVGGAEIIRPKPPSPSTSASEADPCR